MAKIITLKDKDDVTLYPQISLESLGSQIDESPTIGSDNLVTSGGVGAITSALQSQLVTLGKSSFLTPGYVDIYGKIHAPESDGYLTMLIALEEGKTYKYYNEGGSDSLLYTYLNADKTTSLEFGEVAHKTWEELVVPEGASFFAMTVQFGNQSEEGDYTKCCIVEETAYYEYLENLAQKAEDKATETVSTSFVDNTLNTVGVSQSLLNKAVTYVTALGTTSRYYYGYINSSTKLPQYDTTASGLFKMAIAKVEPGRKYYIYSYYNLENLSDSPVYFDQIGTYAFYDASFTYLSDSYVTDVAKNQWLAIVAPEGASYIAMTMEMRGEGNYQKCAVLEANEFVDLSNKTTDTVGLDYTKIQNTVYNGYVTSADLTRPVNFAGSGAYKVIVIPVTTGEKYKYYIDNEMSSYCLSLACFANGQLSQKVDGNLELQYGENLITVPEDAAYMCLTLSFSNSPYSNAVLIKEGTLQDRVSTLENTSTAEMMNAVGVLVKKEGMNLYIATNWDDDHYLVQRMVAHRDRGVSERPSNANFESIRKVLKIGDLSSNGTLLKEAGDDICPVFINGSYVGGNHGWYYAQKVISTAHGKTLADVGAEYVDSGNSNVKFYILRIIDENTILVLSENRGSDGAYSFASPVGPLVYSSNGDSQSNIVVESKQNLNNFHGSVSEANYTLMCDSAIIAADGIYKCDKFTVLESYDILDLPTIATALYSNRPVGGYTQQPIYQNLSGVERIATRSISYTFTPDGTCLVGTSLLAHKKLTLGFDGVVQSINGGNKMYIPKVKAYTHDGTTYDFTKIENWTSFYGQDFTPSFWADENNAPDRAVNFNTTTKMSVMLGYILDRGEEISRNTVVNNAINLASTLKMYPFAVSDGRAMNPGDNYSVIAYRAFTNTTNNPSGRTNYASVNVQDKVFVYVDYHGSLTDTLPVDAGWVGKKITVVDKTNNVSLMTTGCVCGPLSIKSEATSNSYGYIVLELGN